MLKPQHSQLSHRPLARLHCISIGCSQPVLYRPEKYTINTPCTHRSSFSVAGAHGNTRHAQSTTVAAHVVPLPTWSGGATALADESVGTYQIDAFIGPVAVQAVPALYDLESRPTVVVIYQHWLSVANKHLSSQLAECQQYNRGAGIGMFTTEPVSVGQLLFSSQPLATVAVRGDAAASGPSKLIQALLTRLLNPGELEWLQLLNSRETLAKQHTALQDIESSHAPLDPTNSSSSASGAGFNTLFTLLQGSELARLQGLAKGGGRLEQLQLTPMQLAEMVQDCAVTLDGPETAAVASLLAALDSSTAGSAAAVAAGAEALSICGLWPEMGLMKQSCAANVTVTCVLGPAAAGGAAGAPVAAGEEFQEALLVVRAARDLPAGTELFAPSLPSSLDLLQSADSRQQVIVHTGLGDRCYCSRCAQEQQQAQQQQQQQQVLAELANTAAAAVADMTQVLVGGSLNEQQQAQQQNGGGQQTGPWDRSRSPLPGAWNASQVNHSSNNGSRGPAAGGFRYTGDDFESPDANSDGILDVDAAAVDGNGYSSNAAGSTVIAAEFVSVGDNQGTATAAAAGGGLGSSSSSSSASHQQQQEVALEWLQLLVTDLLGLAGSHVAEEQQVPLMPAACYSSWSAIRQALVMLQSTGHDSSSDSLLAAQLEHLLSTSQGDSSSSSSSWGALLLRVYHLQLKTLQEVAPGSLEHVLVASAAAAFAAAAPEALQELGGVSMDSLLAERQAAVAARFGNSLSSSSSSSQLMQACLEAAAAQPGLMPPAAAAAAVGPNNGNGHSSWEPQVAEAAGSSSSGSSSNLEVVEAVVVVPEANSSSSTAGAAAPGPSAAPAGNPAKGVNQFQSSSGDIVSDVIIELEVEQPEDDAHAAAGTSSALQQQQQGSSAASTAAEAAGATPSGSGSNQPWWTAAAAAQAAEGMSEGSTDPSGTTTAANKQPGDSHEDVDFPGDELDAFEDEGGNVIWSAAAAAQAAAALAPEGLDKLDDNSSSSSSSDSSAAKPAAAAAAAAAPWWSQGAGSLFGSAAGVASTAAAAADGAGDRAQQGVGEEGSSPADDEGEDEPELWSAAAAVQAAAAMAPDSWETEQQQEQQQQQQEPVGQEDAPQPRFSRFYAAKSQQQQQQGAEQVPAAASDGDPTAASDTAAAAASQPWMRGPLPSWIKQQDTPAATNTTPSSSSSSSSQPELPRWPGNTTARPAWGIPSYGGDWASMQQQQQQQKQQQQQRDLPRWALLRKRQQQEQRQRQQEEQQRQQEEQQQRRERRSALWRARLDSSDDTQQQQQQAGGFGEDSSAGEQRPRKSAVWRAKMGDAAHMVTSAAVEVSGEAEAVAAAAERMAAEAEAAATAAEVIAAGAAAAAAGSGEGELLGAFEGVAVAAEEEALAAERAAVAAERVAVAAEKVALGAEQIAALAAGASDSATAAEPGPALGAAGQRADGAVGEESEGVSEPVLGGEQPLPEDAVQRLKQLLEWTVEVGGPLTASQQELVQLLIHGSSNSRADLDADQVLLLRKLVGLM